MAKPKVIVFDVNETLLDLEPLRAVIGESLGGRAQLLPLWFSTMLHYSLVETLSDDYHDFGQIGAAALMMVAESQGIPLDEEIARKRIGEAITRLPPHEDVVAALEALAEAGYRVVSLTNSSEQGVAAQFEFAGIGFSGAFSQESADISCRL